MSTEQKFGEVITFYSYKGGTGRTMALANIACLLARRTEVKRGVLMIDWDLEAPGLHRFFYPKTTRRSEKGNAQKDNAFELLPGLIDLFMELQNRINQDAQDEDYQSEESARQILDSFDLESFIWQTEIQGISLLKAGCFSAEYSKHVNTFDWDRLYNRSPWLFRLFAEKLSERYDYVLIDSRTGITDTSGICTMIMPEKLVVVFVPNQQSLTGIAELVHQAITYRNESDDLRQLMVYPLPSRIEDAEEILKNKWRFGDESEGIQGYQSMFEGLYRQEYDIEKYALLNYFDNILIQHKPYYAYGEKIAVNEEREDSTSISRNYRSFMNLLISNTLPWEMDVSGDISSVSSISGDILSGFGKINNYYNVVTSRTSLELPPRPVHFVNRKAELDQLIRDIKPGAIVTLCGPGGIGKTALAAEVVWRLTDEGKALPEAFPDGIIFHSFYNQPQADLALEHIARVFGEEPKPTPSIAAQRALSGRKVLLILDGTENADDLGAVLSVRGVCAVLITSRDRTDALDLTQNIPPLDTDSSVALLLHILGAAYNVDEMAAQRICKLLGGLPLAVNLAGSYLVATQGDLYAFADWLDETPLQALDLGGRRYQSVSVLIDRSLEQLDAISLSVLSVIGHLAISPFNRSVIVAALNLSEPVVERSLGSLIRYGLINRDGKLYILSHALIHTYASRVLEFPDGVLKKLANYYLSLLQSGKGYSVFDDATPHILHILEQITEAQEWEIYTNLAWAIDDYLDLRGRWSKRLQICTIGLETSKKLNDRHSESVWLGKLGVTYQSLGQIESSIEYYQTALSIVREFDDRHDEGVHLGNLGLAYAALGRLEQATECYQVALEIAREIGNRRSEGTYMGSLANVYANLGRYEHALEYFMQSLAIAREIGDRRGESEHLGNLGRIYFNLSQYEQAIEHYQQALMIAREIGDRRSEGINLGYLGLVYTTLSQYERALEYYEQALTITREIGDLRSEGANLGNLGLAYIDFGQYDLAIRYLEQALGIIQQVGDRNTEGFILNNLGRACYLKGEILQAKKYYEGSLDIRKEVLGEKHPDTANSFNNLGRILQDMGDLPAARPYYEQALAINREMIGENHPATAQSINNLGLLLQAMGDLPAARSYLEQALLINRESLGEKHPVTAQSLHNLGTLLASQGDYESARLYYEQALAILQEALPMDHPQIKRVLQSLNNVNDPDYLAKHLGGERA